MLLIYAVHFQTKIIESADHNMHILTGWDPFKAVFWACWFLGLFLFLWAFWWWVYRFVYLESLFRCLFINEFIFTYQKKQYAYFDLQNTLTGSAHSLCLK